MTVTTNKDLSSTYRALRTVIKPLKPMLVKPGKPQPAGSPRITNAPKTKHGFKILERQDTDVWVYDMIQAKKQLESASPPSRHIYYFSGGAFQDPPTGSHWSTVAKFGQSVYPDGYSMTMVSYPLAPNTPAKDSLPILHKWLSAVMASAAEKGDTVQLMGDSAGGNVVLSLTFWWAQQVQSQSAQGSATAKNPLENTIVISPATDMDNSHPEMSKVNKLDPILSSEYTGLVAQEWSKGMNTKDSSISPVYNSAENFQLLKKLGIKIHGVIGTYDVLSPDAIKFKDLCLQHGVEGDWLIWEGQMHCFPLAHAYGIKEGKAALEWIAQILRKQKDERTTEQPTQEATQESTAQQMNGSIST